MAQSIYDSSLVDTRFIIFYSNGLFFLESFYKFNLKNFNDLCIIICCINFLNKCQILLPTGMSIEVHGDVVGFGSSAFDVLNIFISATAFDYQQSTGTLYFFFIPFLSLLLGVWP